MTDQSTTLKRRIGRADVHRRHFTKADGRPLYLYGYEAHDRPPIEAEPLERVTGSHLRRNPLRGDWAVYAAARQNRTFKPSAAEDPLAPTKPGGPTTEIPFEDFDLAVFENRFPSFSAEPGDAPKEAYETAKAAGACEVIVYAPEGEGSLATLGQARRRLLIEAWIDRYEELFAKGCEYVLPFENRGEEVGVTLHHPHGQLYGFPVTPAPQAQAAKAFAEGYDLAAQLPGWRNTYAIAEAGGLMAYTPPFARFPYEVWISALEPVSGPWAFNEEQSDGFAALLGDVTARYDAFFGRATPYMMSLQAAPRGEDSAFQFTVQYYPVLRAPNRIKYLASVEQSTSLFTVDVMPESAAEALRDAL